MVTSNLRLLERMILVMGVFDIVLLPKNELFSGTYFVSFTASTIFFLIWNKIRHFIAVYVTYGNVIF